MERVCCFPGPPSSSVKTPVLPVADPMVAASLVGSEQWSYDILALERITLKKYVAI